MLPQDYCEQQDSRTPIENPLYSPKDGPECISQSDYDAIYDHEVNCEGHSQYDQSPIEYDMTDDNGYATFSVDTRKDIDRIDILTPDGEDGLNTLKMFYRDV